MRLPADAARRLITPLIAGGLSAALAACGTIDRARGDDVDSTLGSALSDVGPAADYPMVLGEPFTVDGQLYTPADSLNYDAVGFARIDDGAGVSAAHRTLPLPSYAEVTSLDSGRTILVRIERRGPMTGSELLSLSAAAAAQLGVSEGAPVRVRRVNPPEAERAALRAGRTAPERMDTPRSLVQVLRRKLPAAGAVNLAPVNPDQRSEHPRLALVEAPAAPSSGASASTGYPLAQLGPAPVSPEPPVVTHGSRKGATAMPAQPAAAHKVTVAPAAAQAAKGAYVIQAGAFASRGNADRAAKQLGGFISTSGRLFRVRTGPFPTRGQAEAALAKVRAAGYTDARVTTVN